MPMLSSGTTTTALEPEASAQDPLGPFERVFSCVSVGLVHDPLHGLHRLSRGIVRFFGDADDAFDLLRSRCAVAN